MLTPRILAATALLAVIVLILTRLFLLKRRGTNAMKFGQTNKSDFLLPPFALFYFYIIFAAAFQLPTIAHKALFTSEILQWLGVILCFLSAALILWSLRSFGKSFRVGIDKDRPDQLTTTGIFAITRNPMYVAFLALLLGEFLAFPNLIPLLYLVVAAAIIHRQILREESFLRAHYGAAYIQYQRKVRRYL